MVQEGVAGSRHLLGVQERGLGMYHFSEVLLGTCFGGVEQGRPRTGG